MPESLRGVVQAGLDRQNEADWAGAAMAWRALQRAAAEQQHRALELDAWVRLADVLRRADQPAQALQALRGALGLEPDAEQRTMLRIQSAALLLDTGELEQAERRARACVQDSAGPLRALALDSLAATLATRGDRIGFAEIVEQLEAMGPGPASLAARFRRARLERLQGYLDESEATLAGLADSLNDNPRAQGAVGAALTQLAQLALLRGHLPEAELLLSAADSAWREAGREVGSLEVLALRAELALAQGVTAFLPGWLDRAVDYAEERHLVLLEARLRRVRGQCRVSAGSEAGHADLDIALLLSETAGAHWLSGRIRLERVRLGLGCEGQDACTQDLENAIEELTGDRVWTARARQLLSERLLLEGQRPAAMEQAASALCQFKASGLDADEARARAVLESGG